ncbi:MAG: hypothetical protein KAS12_04070 [Candidatus Aenigmarchaeota archaeon]|nr:hypothetical protein [Candidatus Aenigmarchaeota archaeon]
MIIFKGKDLANIGKLIFNIENNADYYSPITFEKNDEPKPINQHNTDYVDNDISMRLGFIIIIGPQIKFDTFDHFKIPNRKEVKIEKNKHDSEYFVTDNFSFTVKKTLIKNNELKRIFITNRVVSNAELKSNLFFWYCKQYPAMNKNQNFYDSKNTIVWDVDDKLIFNKGDEIDCITPKSFKASKLRIDLKIYNPNSKTFLREQLGWDYCKNSKELNLEQVFACTFYQSGISKSACCDVCGHELYGKFYGVAETKSDPLLPICVDCVHKRTPPSITNQYRYIVVINHPTTEDEIIFKYIKNTELAHIVSFLNKNPRNAFMKIGDKKIRFLRDSQHNIQKIASDEYWVKIKTKLMN